MKVALLSKTNCLSTPKLIKFFDEKNFKIDCVIIENNFRKKFSPSEIEYRQTHDKFNRITKKYSILRRVLRIMWDMSPSWMRKLVETKLFYIPILNKFSLKKYCLKCGIDVFEVIKHSSEKTVDIVKNRRIDYILLLSSNWLIKNPILSIENVNIINAHSGMLPKHKGLDSIAWSIIEGDDVGITTHFVDEGVDSGDILKFYKTDIKPEDDFNSICRNTFSMQAYTLYDTLIELGAGKINPQKQDGFYKPHKPVSLNQLLEINSNLKIK